MQEAPTTHATEVTTSETEKPVSKSEPTPIVEKGSQDSERPAIIDPGGDDKKETVKDEKEDAAKSEQEATEREKKGIVKEGSRQEPPVPLDVKEDPEEVEEDAELPKEAQVHDKETHVEKTGESKSEDDARVPGKKVVVDEKEQKKLIDRLNVLEQKVIKLSDDKKKEKEGESEADTKKTDTVDLQKHNRDALSDNGTHWEHGETGTTKHTNDSSERIARQQVDDEGQVQQKGGEERSVKPTQPVSPHPTQDGGADAAKEEEVTKEVASEVHKDQGPEDEQRDKEDGRGVEVGDSHVGKDLKREAPLEEDEREAEKEAPEERTKRDVFIEENPEEVNPDTTPSEAAQDLSPYPEADSKEGEGKDELEQDAATNTDGTTANADL